MFRKNLTSAAFKVAAIYLLVGGAWVVFSDEILAGLVHDNVDWYRLSMVKGGLFVLVTAVMLYFLIRRAMREITRSRNFYLKIFDEFPAMIWRAGTDAGCDYFNKTWLAFTGRTFEQERGDGWTEGVHPEDLDHCLKTYRESFASRQPFTLEYRLRRHDGAYRWIIDHGRPYYDLRDTFAGYVGSCYDVTEQKQLVQALSRSERRFRELSENTSDWVWEVDAELRYVYASPKVMELLGYAPAEVLGKTPFDLMPAEEAARLRPAIEDHARNPRPFKDIENVNVHKNGSRVVLETSGVPFYDGEGRFAGLRGIDRDISARKEAEERVRQLNAQLAHKAAALEAANRELEEFSHAVSHDLRTPLTSISLSCQVVMELCGSEIKEQCRSVLQGICTTIQRMDQLITSLLNLSRISSRDLNFEVVDLTAMAKIIAAELRLNQPDRRVLFNITDGVTASGDASLLRVVLANLLGNAWKYTGKKELAVIEFGIMEAAGNRIFFVRDNGTGFDMSRAGKLFHAFQRLHSDEEYEGHGIGLATVQRIVQRHGGRIWAEGEEGKGSTFYFTLAPAEPPTVAP